MKIPEYFLPKTDPAGVWEEYERCKGFNQSIDLYDTVKVNERFISGDQWHGVKAPDMDKPVFNFLNRVVMYEVSLIVSDNIGVVVSTQHDDDNPTSQAIARYLEQKVQDVMEDTSFQSKSRTCIRDCAVSGDCCLYVYWDEDDGKVKMETVPNTSVLFGNPAVNLVQEQPYIILEQNRDLKDVRWQAYSSGIKNWEEITADADTSTRESDTDTDSQRPKSCTVLKKFWRDLATGNIWFTECTRTVTLREATDTEMSLYPLAWMNWETVKENYHGKAIITGLIDNQIALNRAWAGVLWHMRQNAFPKVFYDRSKIPVWDNKPGAAYGVSGGITDAVATAFEPPKMDAMLVQIMTKLVDDSRDFMGVNDTVLGNINPTNTSAIIAVQKATATPLELQKLAFFTFVEDIVRVTIDVLLHFLGVRPIQVKMTSPDPMTGQAHEVEAVAMVDFGAIDYDDLKLQVDVGEAAYWSELTQVQTLDNLYSKGLIPDPVTYLEEIPDKLFPHKSAIVEKMKQAMQGQQNVNVDSAIDLLGQSDLAREETFLKNREAAYDAQMQDV